MYHVSIYKLEVISETKREDGESSERSGCEAVALKVNTDAAIFCTAVNKCPCFAQWHEPMVMYWCFLSGAGNVLPLVLFFVCVNFTRMIIRR